MALQSWASGFGWNYVLDARPRPNSAAACVAVSLWEEKKEGIKLEKSSVVNARPITWVSARLRSRGAELFLPLESGGVTLPGTMPWSGKLMKNEKKKETPGVSHQLKDSVRVQKLKEGEDGTKGFFF